MAKASTRFRNRKINFKSRIAVRTGAQAVDFEEDGNGFDGEVEFEEDKDGKGGNGVDTGVDKEEEGEVHLQAVLASSNASVSRPNAASGLSSTRGGAAAAAAVAAGTSKLVPKAFIPTPDSTGTIDAELFAQLYPPNSYVDPMTYIRFSDTVEDAQIGATAYTMDEEDEDWLEAFNAQFSTEGKLVDETNGGTPGGRGARERKGKGEKGSDKGKDASVPGPLGDDEFEEIMELFERVTEEKAPMAHVNPSSLPALHDLEPAFTEPLAKPPLASLKIFAKTIYPHWKERRLKRGGKAIIPQLDYDESNESNPYVCFRRRELKTSRKTRRSDAQNIERLIRLRNDLHAAHALMLKTRDRERLKLEAIELERKIFESRVEMRDLKRHVGEAEGDEDLLIGRREKRRRREDAPQSAGSIRLSLRKPDPANFSPTSLITSIEDLKVRKERAAAINQRMERDLHKKRETDQNWEDWTDGAYLARPPPIPARFWRAVEPVPGPLPFSSAHGKHEALSFATAYQPALGHVRTSFRRRVGRGGRVMLDRIAPGMGHRARTLPSARSDVSDDDEEDAATIARREERFRYDTDAGTDFPSVDEPVIIDDFDLGNMLKRASLLRPADVESIALDGVYIEEAYRWAAQEPERNAVPPVVYGRPTPRPPMAVQPGGPGGLPMTMAAASAATAAHRIAHLKRQSQGGQSEPLRKSPSTNGSPLVQGQPLPMQQVPMPMPLPMSMPINGTPVQGAWMNVNANHLLQQQQLQNGIHLQPNRLPNGANNLPATSRLSAPPFSNAQQQAQMQLVMQQQQHQQQQQQQQQFGAPSHPLSSPVPHNQRPPSAQQLPSRPGSAASSHHSPSLSSQLPLVSPGLSPRNSLSRPSPQMNAQQQQQLKQQGMQGMQMPFTGFAQG